MSQVETQSSQAASASPALGSAPGSVPVSGSVPGTSRTFGDISGDTSEGTSGGGGGGVNFVTWLRYTALLEGVSFLVLLGVAMPLKYFAGMPMAVRIAGSVHGLLFVVLVLMLLLAKPRLSWKWIAITFVATLIPFGPFVVDPKLKRFA